MTLFISLLVFGLTFVTGFLLTNIAVKYSDEHKEARTDAPTKLLNRRAYAEDIQKLKASRRLEKLRYVSLDLNGLKEANDTLGHEAGDELIKNTARFMMTAFDHLGKLYRTGGDEFVALLMCDRANYEEALDIFNEGVELWKSVRGRPFSVSVGEASKEEFPDFSIDELAKCADKRMYEAKDEYYRKTGKTRRK
jgi:diguanylate cyclase (GGDEF)-like protein